MNGLIIAITLIIIGTLTNANPLPPSSHPFDLGILDSCVLPTATQLSDCTQFIDYPVPSVLLSSRLLDIKHKRIMAARSNAYTNEMTAGNVSLADTCATTALKHKCREEFPPCYTTSNDIKMVAFTPPDPCLSPAAANPCTYYQPSCGITSVNVSLTTCHLTSQLNDYNYTHCSTLSGWSSTYITKWMHVFLQNVEREIDKFSLALNSDAARNVCVPLYAELQCGSVGRCSHQGTRVEMNATQEACNAVMSCVGSNLRDKITKFINCSHYPSSADKLPTQATPITPPTTAPPTAPPTNTTTIPTDSTTRPGTHEPTVLFPDSPSRVTSPGSSLTSYRLIITILSTVCILCSIVLVL